MQITLLTSLLLSIDQHNIHCCNEFTCITIMTLLDFWSQMICNRRYPDFQQNCFINISERLNK